MSRRLMRSAVLTLALAASLVGCSAPSGTVTVGASASTAASSPSTGESTALTAQLVPVPGFQYMDISDAERALQLAALPSHITAASFHGVVDESSGAEAVFLALYEGDPGDAAHSESYAQRMASASLETDAPEALSFAGQRVWFAEEPANTDSRYQYFWDRRGTLGWVDGPDRAVVERFLSGYFTAVGVAARADPLERPLIDVPGYSFTRAIEPSSEKEAVLDALPDATEARLLYAFDREHAFGGLVLAGPVAPMTGPDLLSAAQAWQTATAGAGSGALAPGADLQVSDLVVHRLDDAAGEFSMFVWQGPDTGVVAWLATTRPDLGVDLVTAIAGRT